MATEQAPTYFISDLHLEASRPNVTRAFKHFLSSTARGARAIYILGDFVDAWIGDDDSSEFARELKTALAKSASSGTRIYFLHGNRDFLIGKKFADDTGVTLLDEHTVVPLYGENILLLHGDTLCTDDTDYMKFREKVRNPQWKNKVLRYPLFLRKIIASHMRSKSRKENANKAEQIMDVSEDAVKDMFTKFNVSIMLHGHTHRPNRHTYDFSGKPCERIVLGDWEEFGWFVKADTTGLYLEKFAIIPQEVPA